MNEAITLRDALTLPQLTRGNPRVLAGHASLDNRIRWVHAVEARYLASVIQGGELLLTQGMSLKCSDAELEAFSNELAEQRVAGLVVELGPVLKTTPRGLIAACVANGLPLVELNAPVRFIDVAEAIDTAIVNRDYGETRRTLAFQEALTDGLLKGGGCRELLMTAAQELGKPVVLEHVGGGVDYGFPASWTERDARAAWLRFTHQPDGGVAASEVRIEARDGSPAGRLVSLDTTASPPDGDGAALRALGSYLEIAESRSPHEHSLRRPADGGILAALVDGRLDATDALEFDLSLQLSSEATVGVPVAIRRARRSQGHSVAEEERAWQSMWRDVVRELRGRQTNVLIGPDRLTAPTFAVLGMRTPDDRAPAAEEFAKLIAAAAERRMGDAETAVVCVGPAAYTWDGIIGGLRTALDSMPGALSGPVRLWHDALTLDLEHLFWTVRDHPEYVRFAHHRVSALRVHDVTHNTQLFETLREFLRCGGQKAATARALSIERQSLYYRISRIESVLGVDLADTETLFSLHIAVRIAAHIDYSEAEKFVVSNGLLSRNRANRPR